MKAGIEVERRVRWKERETLSSLKLHKEVESAIIVGVGHNSSPSNPQIDLYINDTQYIYIYTN